MQQALSRHVRAQLDGSSGTIAATLASGDRGAIAEEDAQAMRDSGLAHLLSISGLHVSALIAVAYFVALRLAGLVALAGFADFKADFRAGLTDFLGVVRDMGSIL